MDDGIEADFPLSVGYFHLARNVAKLSNFAVKVGCVLAKKKPLIACSNKLITHPDLFPGAITIHAEARALNNCRTDDLVGGIAYVYRETADGQPAMARPCNWCMMKLKERGIKKVFYSISEYPYYNWERI